ncbi:MAG: DnaB-like helicase N-terminal domain-containing protein [bacterium]
MSLRRCLTIKTNNSNSAFDFQNHTFAEKALLSAILSLQDIRKAQENITADDFYDFKNKSIYVAMTELSGMAEYLNEVDLIATLGSDYQDLIYELLEMNGLQTDIYLDKVKQNSLSRRKISAIEDFRTNKISDKELIDIIGKIAHSGKGGHGEFQPAINLIIENKEPIDVFGIPIEFGSIGVLAGATGTGKTEYMAEIADIFAKQDKNNMVLLCYFEGSDKHIRQRLALKNINNPNILYSIKPDFQKIERFIDDN